MGNLLDICNNVDTAVMPESRIQVLIRSATGLKNSDVIGKSDPYCECRIGLIGTSWNSKSEKTHRQSPPILETLNPEWNFATAYEVPKTMEVVKTHSNNVQLAVIGAVTGSTIGYVCTQDPSVAFVGAASGAVTTLAAGSVYDNNKKQRAKNQVQPLPNVSVNDLELHVRIMDNDLFSKNDVLGEVSIPLSELIENDNSATEYYLDDNAGKIVVMTGSNVSQVSINEIQSQLGGDQSLIYMNSFQQYLSKSDDDIVYNTTMVQFLAAGISGDTGLRDWFLEKSKGTGKWNGPEDSNCITYMNYDEVNKRLSSLPEKFGKDNNNGQVAKNNNLGFQKLNSTMWPELPEGNRCIGLGQTQENHAISREFMDKLLGANGNWESGQIKYYAEAFFNDKHSFSTSDFRIWTTIVLHKIHFNIDLTWEEGEEFMDMQKKILVCIAPGDNIMNIGVVQQLLDVNDILKQKNKWLKRYLVAISALLQDEFTELTAAQQVMVTSNLMDSLLFAGGQSVPTVISYCVSLLYSEWLNKKLPGFTLSTNNLYQYVMEVIRFFPPVSGFVYKERSRGTIPSTNVYLNLHTAQCDKNAWGENAHDFVLRPLKDYMDLMLAWANSAVHTGEYKNNSRACPAKDLSICMIVSILTEFIKTTVPDNTDMNGELLLDRNMWLSDVNPNDIKVNNYSLTGIHLSRNRTGHALTNKEIESFWFFEKGDKFDEIDNHTKVFIALVQATVDPSQQDGSDKVNVILPKTKLEVKYEIGNTGIKLTPHDEDEEGNYLVNLLKSAAFYATKRFSFKDKLVWFDSKEEAITAMRNDFGSHLPPQYHYWDDVSSDSAMERICFHGVGQMHLRNCPDHHKGPDNSHYEINLEYLSKYATRKNFIRYGSIIYFDKGKKLVGIWSCDQGKLFSPQDTLWEHVKFAFRSTLVTDMTLKHHLANVHLIISNQLMFAARETCSENHPLRKLLKAHYYRAAAINWGAKEILIPVGQLAHRTWAFTEESWGELFNDVFSLWEYKPFPQLLSDANLDCKNDLPMYEDGIKLWNVLKKYVTNYLSSKITSDKDELIKDSDVVDFWNHFDKDFKYGLPELSFNHLVDHVTNSIWWCTAGHEMVGSIVEYLVHPDGLMSKICPGQTIADAQTFAQDLTIISLTGLRQPALMNDWEHLYEDEDDKKYVRECQKELAKLSNEIDESNKSRLYPYDVMNPKMLESSVSI